jgi:hypothetical protein
MKWGWGASLRQYAMDIAMPYYNLNKSDMTEEQRINRAKELRENWRFVWKTCDEVQFQKWKFNAG